jgi:hypothetical protein
LWVSPQSDWGWPPPKEIATSSYRTRIEDRILVLEGRTYPKLEIAVTKRVSMDPRCDCAVLEHTLTNRGTVPHKTAPWLNSRMRPGGLTLYPTSGPVLAASTLNLDTSGDITFFQHDRQPRPSGMKSFADSRDGWLAHADGDLLFVQSFPDVPKEQQAPGEAEIELYVDGGGRFVEIEQQGPYAEIPAGGSVTWTVRWYLRKIPAGVEVKAQSRALVDLVRSILR